MTNEQQGSSLFEGLLLGGIIGAALGVMFAPAAGEKLKELDLDEVIDRFSDAFEEGKKEAERVLKEEAE